jgi:hypothetical protein
VLLIGHASVGPLTQSRLTGTAAGISEVLPRCAPATVANIDAKGGVRGKPRVGSQIPETVEG